MSDNIGGFTRRDFMKTAGIAGLALGAVSAGLGLAVTGCKKSDPEVVYPIDDEAVATTLDKTVAFDSSVTGLASTELPKIAQYAQYGYGVWTDGPPLPAETRADIMPSGYDTAVATKAKLLRFFAMTDIHITDKESPSQAIYLQQLNKVGGTMTSIYSPIMLYTPHVLDAAVQTVNALHKKSAFDFGISLGDTCNNTQYNETRWYIDVLDGKVITPSSGAHLGAGTIEYQKPFKAAGIDKSIPWYQTVGNHDHFWLGSFPMNDARRQSCTSADVFAAGDVLVDPRNINKPDYYMGVLDGETTYGDIIDAGPVANFRKPPTVTADPDRRSLTTADWMQEFSNTTSKPTGHGFNLVDSTQTKGFACYSFVPKSTLPLKMIVMDDTQADDDNSLDFHGHGFLDQARWDFLKKELADGQANGQLMIIAAHVPIGVQPYHSEFEWWVDPSNAVTYPDLLTELQNCPNLLMWIAGHRHFNTVKAFVSPDPVNAPEKGFWQVETSSLRDFPQQFRTFDIRLNSDYSISIATTDVDPAVKAGSPAAKSRAFAVATQQIVNTLPIYQNPPTMPDASIKPMPTGSYNAVLFKQLSQDMKAKLKRLFPA